MMEKNIASGNMLDDYMLTAIKQETNNWRQVLKIIIDAILFCAKNNLAFRGTKDAIGNPNSGIFLNLIDFVSRYNDTLKNHIETHKKGTVSYFSPKIQNEIINLVGEKTRSVIISRVQQAKYYSILFDCTPDVSRKEQMSQVIRYVYIDPNGKVKIEESFIDFLQSHEKTGEGLTTEILNKLQLNNLNIDDIRGQGYDNGANMAGKYKGVQARILEINNFAIFVPCAAHNLNLAGVHAVSTTSGMVTFFGTIQRLFNFFSSSTTRRENLMKFLKLSLKGFSDTRWSSKADAIKSLCLQLPEVKKELERIKDDLSNSEAVSNAKSLLVQINYKFICILHVWNKILQCVDRANKALQHKNLSIDLAKKLIDGLRCSLQGLREAGFKQIISDAQKVALKMNIEAEFSNQRIKRIKEESVTNLNQENLFAMQMYNIFDILLSETDWRYRQMKTIFEDFSFLFGSSLESMSVVELQKVAADLSRKYDKDLNSHELSCEIESFKFQVCGLVENLKEATPLNLLQTVHDFELVESYQNIVVALRIFLTLPVTTASCERSFSKLKLIKNYLRSSLSQQRLSNLSIISIESNIVQEIDFNNIIDEFAEKKARRMQFE